MALALAAPLLLLVARQLPEDGVGLYLRLFAAAVCVLVLPGALIMRALAWQPVPALALTGSVVLSLAVAMGAFAITFLVGGTIMLALAIMGLAVLAALVPAALARVYRRAGERLAFVVLVVAAIAYGGVVWWVAHSIGTGDVLFHLARARKIADGEALSSLNVVNEFRDGGLHPGYAFPLWHGVLAAIAKLAGVDVSLVVLHLSSVLVPVAFAAAYAAGRALFGSWIGGAAVLAAQAAQIGFSRGGVGLFQFIDLPASFTRAVLVPALLAFLFAYLRERDRRAAPAARGLAHWPSSSSIRPTSCSSPFRSPGSRCSPSRSCGPGARPSPVSQPPSRSYSSTVGLFLAWLQPTIASTESFRPAQNEVQRALGHYGDQLEVRGSNYRLAPDVLTRAGPVVIAGFLLLPLAAVGVRRRYGAYAAGGMLACLAVLLIPVLFTHFSDLVSISQSRRLAAFLPVPFVIAAAAVLVGRARAAGVVIAFAGGLALELAYSAGGEPGPVWPLWVAVIGGAAGIAAGVLLPVRWERLLDPTRWAALAALVFVLPHDRRWARRPEPPGRARHLRAHARDRDRPARARRRCGRARSRCRPSYRVGAFAPVYVVAMPAPHVANTKANRPYRRQRDAIRFFSRSRTDAEREATIERYGADWLLVDKRASYPEAFVRGLDLEYQDGRYALYRLPGDMRLGLIGRSG